MTRVSRVQYYLELLVVVLVLAAPSPASGQLAPQEPPEGHVSGAITVFERAELEGLPFVTLEQLLRHDVGIQISSQSLHGRQSFPAIRGSGQAFGSGIVLRVDGQRIDDSFYGSPFVYARYFPIAQVRKLVIYRGTSSSSICFDATDAVVDIFTLDGPTQAELLVGKTGISSVATQWGGRGHLSLAAGDFRLGLWTHALEDEGFRQRIDDAAGRPVTTIDPLATLSYGGSLSYHSFFVRLHGSYYATRRGLVYGFKSHLNRARHSQVTLMAGLDGTARGTPARLTLQIGRGRANILGLLVPRGIRPQTADEPLAEDYVLNEWMGDYRIALRGSTIWPLGERFSLRLGMDASWSVVDKAKQQGTHDPETFAFEHSLAEYGDKAVNLPRAANRHAFGGVLSLRYSGDAISGMLDLGVTHIRDRGFFYRARAAVMPHLRASARWDYAELGHLWIAAATGQDVPPWAVQYLENHPLWAGRAGGTGYDEIQPEYSDKAEGGVTQLIFGRRLRTALVLFYVSDNQLHHQTSEPEAAASNAPCAIGECLPVRRFSNVYWEARTGIEWTLSGRYDVVDFDLYVMRLLRTRSKRVSDFSRLSGGLRAITHLGAHRLGLAASAFDAFAGEPWYVVVDLRWSYPLASWGWVTLTGSNLTGATPGGLPRTMPRGYPSRGTTVVLQLEIRDLRPD